ILRRACRAEPRTQEIASGSKSDAVASLVRSILGILRASSGATPAGTAFPLAAESAPPDPCVAIQRVNKTMEAASTTIRHFGKCEFFAAFLTVAAAGS